MRVKAALGPGRQQGILVPRTLLNAGFKVEGKTCRDASCLLLNTFVIEQLVLGEQLEDQMRATETSAFSSQREKFVSALPFESSILIKRIGTMLPLRIKRKGDSICEP